MAKKPIMADEVREHRIYSMFEDKKKSPFAELKKMREEMFIDLSSIKVAPYTQLPLLC